VALGGGRRVLREPRKQLALRQEEIRISIPGSEYLGRKARPRFRGRDDGGEEKCGKKQCHGPGAGGHGWDRTITFLNDAVDRGGRNSTGSGKSGERGVRESERVGTSSLRGKGAKGESRGQGLKKKRAGNLYLHGERERKTESSITLERRTKFGPREGNRTETNLAKILRGRGGLGGIYL